jgi:outer membrane protein assembly factor BamB
MKKFIILNTFICFLFLAWMGCKKEKVPAPAPPSPTPVVTNPRITSFAITDYCLRKVTITGTDFHPDIFKNKIFFGTIQGVIDSVTTTKIYARYHSGNISAYIKVSSNGLETTSTDIFAVTIPVITSFTPAFIRAGVNVTIIGNNLDGTDSVLFNYVKGTIISASTNQLIVQAPQGVTPGLITVHSKCQFATAPTPYTYSTKGVVYISGNSGYCHAIDIATGSLIWKKHVDSRASASMTYNNGRIFLGSTDVNNLSNNRMYALDAWNGSEIWTYPTGPFSDVPLFNQGIVYGGSFDKKFYAFNATTGQPTWTYTAPSYFRSYGPTYYNGNIFIGNDDGYLYSLNALTGAFNWKLQTYPGGNAAVYNGVLYAPGSFMLYAINPNTGNIIWSYPITHLSGNSPTIVNGIIYIGSGNHHVYAIDAATGTLLWRKEVGWWMATGIYHWNNTLYFTIGGGPLIAMNATTGDIIWQKPFIHSNLPGHSPLVVNGTLFIGDDEGTLHAMDATNGNTIWKYYTIYSIISGAVVVDQNDVLFHCADAGVQH